MNGSRKNKYFRILWSLLPWLVVLLLLFIAVLFGLKTCDKQKQLALQKAQATKSEQQPISVVAQIIRPGTMTDMIDLPAIVRPWEELVVKAEITGKVIATPVDEGHKVEKDQIVVQVDPRDYQNNIQSILARQKLAKTNFQRQQGLIDKNAVSQANYDEAAATLEDLNAAMKNARLNLERCTIRSPFSGVVNELHAKIGALLSHGDPVFKLLDIDKLKVDVAIPESEVFAVKDISHCKITFTALNNHTVTGKKIFLSSEAVQPAMVYILRLAVANPGHAILPGMFARVQIVKRTITDAVSIPLYGVITQNEEQYVYVAEANIARKRRITTGFLEGWKVQILSGLSAGDMVIIVGHRSIEDGQPVNIIQSLENPDMLAPPGS